MKKVCFILMLGVLAILIPGTLLKTIAPSMIAPNLLAVILVYLAFYEANSLGAFLAFCLGLELDLCSAILLGPWAGAYVLSFAIIVLSSKRVFTESILVVFIAVLVVSLMTTFFHHLTLMLVNDGLHYEWDVVLDALIEAGLGAVCAPFLIHIFRRKSKRHHDSMIVSNYQTIKY